MRRGKRVVIHNAPEVPEVEIYVIPTEQPAIPVSIPDRELVEVPVRKEEEKKYVK